MATQSCDLGKYCPGRRRRRPRLGPSGAEWAGPGHCCTRWTGRLERCPDQGAQTLDGSGRNRFDSAPSPTYRVPRLGLPSRCCRVGPSASHLSHFAWLVRVRWGCGRGWCGKPPGLTPRGQPRNVTRVAPETSRKAVDGARPLLENSTACRKSVPTTPSGSAGRSWDRSTLATDSFGTTSDKLVKTSDHAVSDGTS
jgi:hypothetical protein